jgi:predicted nucleic acid-binding Zn ribbon protein
MTPAGQDRRCHRCLQPVPLKARRCPHCGDILTTDNTRKLTLGLAVLGLIAILAIVGFGLYMSPPTADPENNPETERRGPPPKPVKKPPLN